LKFAFLDDPGRKGTNTKKHVKNIGSAALA